MKKAVMIGAGQIGRGFIGMLLEQAGYHVVFADINTDVINDINTRKEYTVHLVDTECLDFVVLLFQTGELFLQLVCGHLAIRFHFCTSVLYGS